MQSWIGYDDFSGLRRSETKSGSPVIEVAQDSLTVLKPEFVSHRGKREKGSGVESCLCGQASTGNLVLGPAEQCAHGADHETDHQDDDQDEHES